MKKLGIVVVVLAACLLGLPPVLGSIGQSQVEQRIATINANELMAIDVLSYDRGLYTSRAVLEIGLSPAYVARLEAASGADGVGPGLALLTDNELTVVVDLTHGPVAVADGVHFGLTRLHAYPDPEAAGNRALQQQLGMDALFDFRGRVGYGGTLNFDLDVSAVDYADEMSVFAMAPLTAMGSFDGQRLVTDSSLESLYYKLGPIAMTLSDLHGEGDNEFLSTNVALGTFDVAIASATVVNELDATAPLFDAEDVAFKSDVDIDASGELLDGSLEYNVGSARTSSDMSIEDGRLRLNMSNLDAAAIQDYVDVTNRYAAAPPADPEAMLTEMLPILERMLAAEPRLSIDPLGFVLDGEPFVATVHVDSNAAALPQSGGVDLQDPSLWLDLLGVDAEAAVSKPLAETLAVRFVSMQLGGQGMPPAQAEQMARAQAGFMLVTLVGQGMLVDDGNNYTAALRFANGALTLNGNPLPFGF